MEIEKTEAVTVNAKTLKIRIKVVNRFYATLVSAAGNVLKEYDHYYIPGLIPRDHYGDYVILDIDIDTGQITNWKPPTAEQIQDFIASDG